MSPEQDGQPGKAAYEYILLHLSEPKNLGEAKPNEPFLARSIRFDSKKPSIRVGRSSKTISKKLLPSKENAYFDSAVVSREHAEITADLEKGASALHLTDIGSMHGTAVNDQPIKASTPTVIKSGDVVRFGVHVARGLDVFFPTECRVDIDMKPVRASYQAPDPIDLSDDESEYSDSSALNYSQHDSASSYGDGVDADVTIGEGIASSVVSKALPVDGHSHKGDNAPGPDVTMKQLVNAAFGYGDSEGESEDSDIDMEEEEEEEEEEDGDDEIDEIDERLSSVREEEEEDDFDDEIDKILSSVQEEEEEKDIDDGAQFLFSELDNYNKHTEVLDNAPTTKDLPPFSTSESNLEGEEDQGRDDDDSAEVDAGNAETKTSELNTTVENEMPSVAQSAVKEKPTSTAAVINISNLLNPLPFSPPRVQESTKEALAASMRTLPRAEKEPVSEPVPEALVKSVADEIAAWSAQAVINEAMPGDDVFVDAPDAADSRSQGSPTSKKRKADDMLAHVGTVDDLLTQTADVPTPAEKKAVAQDTPPAVKRPATAKAVLATKTKRRGVAWAVAEKVGIAALGGAVVLGSLIYTAPSF